MKTPEQIEAQRQKCREYYAKNRAAQLARKEKYRLENREKVLETQRKCRSENGDSYAETDRKYKLLPSTKEARNARTRQRWKEDPQFKWGLMLRNTANTALRAKNPKMDKYLKWSGCTFAVLKNQIESKFIGGMAWSNWGTWHIDHIVALTHFDLTVESERLKAFHYTNLQPLWAAENMSKGAKIGF